MTRRLKSGCRRLGTPNRVTKEIRTLAPQHGLKALKTNAEMLGQARAITSLRPTVQAALTLRRFNGNLGDLPLDGLVAELGRQCEEVLDRDNLARAEAMLLTQAHTLDSIFNSLAQRAALNIEEHLPAADTYLRLALKAQAQSRATLETLAAIKNPPNLSFVRQANISAGPQQVNNGVLAGDTRAGISQFSQNKLMEPRHEQRLDSGAASAAGAHHSSLEALETINRPKERSG